jgi:uncharacterized protein (TIGR03067 family)
MRSAMLYHGRVIVLTGFLAVSGLQAPSKGLPEPAKKELKALEGKWRVVKFVHSDRETTPGMGEDEVTVEFNGYTIDFAGSAAGVVAELDPTTDPKCLDFKARVGSGVFTTGSTYESVYKLDGNTLTWAVYTGRGKNRPVTLDKPTDAGVMVLELTRVKE